MNNNNDDLKKSFKIYNIEENEEYNQETESENINYNSLYEIFSVNKENDELIKENNDLKNKLMKVILNYGKKKLII